MSEFYGELVQAFEAIPRSEWESDLQPGFGIMLRDGPPASVAFIEQLLEDVVLPVLGNTAAGVREA